MPSRADSTCLSRPGSGCYSSDGAEAQDAICIFPSLRWRLLVDAPAAAQFPVETAQNQPAKCCSRATDAALAANKKLVFDFWRVVQQAHHADRAARVSRRRFRRARSERRDRAYALVESMGRSPSQPIKADDRRPRHHRRRSATSSCVAFRRELLDLENEGQTYTTTRFDLFRVANGKIVEHWTTGRRTDAHRSAQYCTPCAARNASASRPRSSASVASMPACVQVAAATVIERGAPTTGQPVVGSRMWP